MERRNIPEKAEYKRREKCGREKKRRNAGPMSCGRLMAKC